MGSFNIGDAATGQSIKSGERVVALVIDRRVGGFPDATTHAALGGTNPTHMFEPVSLPIRGIYDDYGNLKPDHGQLSVRLMLDLVNQKTWESFEERAFGVRGGTVLGKAAHGIRDKVFGEDDGHRERPLGLAVYRRSTWDALLAASGRTGRDADVATVLAAMERVRVDARADAMLGARNWGLLRLEQSAYVGPEGRERLPDLSRALASREGGDLLGDVAADWLRERRGAMLGYASAEAEPSPHLPELLGALWDLQAAEAGLNVLGKPYMPSQSVGQHDNAPEAFALSLATMRDAGGALLKEVEEYGSDTAAERLEALLAEVETLREGLSIRLAEARADTGFTP